MITLDQKFISKYDADEDDEDDGDRDDDDDEDDCNIETMMMMKSCKTPTNVHKCSP